MIAYASRKLSKTEQNTSTTMREFLAQVCGTQHFRYYLKFQPKFTVITDHAALQYIFQMTEKSSKVTSWLLKLSDYNYDTVIKTGKSNGNADGMSRIICAISTFTIGDIRSHQLRDEECKVLRKNSNFNCKTISFAKLQKIEIETSYQNHYGKQS